MNEVVNKIKELENNNLQTKNDVLNYLKTNVDLKDKMGKGPVSSDFFLSSHNILKSEALSALVMLGFAKNLAEKSLDKVIRASTSELSVEQAIKQTLKNL